MDTSDLQFRNASPPIVVTPRGTSACISCPLSPWTPTTILLSSTIKDGDKGDGGRDGDGETGDGGRDGGGDGGDGGTWDCKRQ